MKKYFICEDCCKTSRCWFVDEDGEPSTKGLKCICMFEGHANWREVSLNDFLESLR